MSILALWVPAYAAEGLVKAVTALLAIGTAILVWPLAPRLFALPSAVQLGRLNAELAGKVEEQERTSHLLRQSEKRVRLANAELERRVEERTADWRAANERVMYTMAQLRWHKADLEGMAVAGTAMPRPPAPEQAGE